jgi:hypothetical protein
VRAFILPESREAEAGVLTVTVPKKEEAMREAGATEVAVAIALKRDLLLFVQRKSFQPARDSPLRKIALLVAMQKRLENSVAGQDHQK